jgi:hypothetical protein
VETNHPAEFGIEIVEYQLQDVVLQQGYYYAPSTELQHAIVLLKSIKGKREPEKKDIATAQERGRK